MTDHCSYLFSDGSVCNEPIYRATHFNDETPTGWRHERGDESRGMCHWATPELVESQASNPSREG